MVYYSSNFFCREIATAAVLVLTALINPVVSPSKSDGFRFRRLKDVSFKEGDTIQALSGEVMVAIADNALAFVTKRRCWDSETFVNVIIRPDEKLERKLLVRRLNPQPEHFDKDRSVALIKRLVGKILPHGSRNCNAKQYMFYIVWGIPHTGPMKDCPLTRNISKEPLYKFLEDDFFLTDGKRNNILVRDLQKVLYVTYAPTFDKERRLITEQRARAASDVPSSSGTKPLT